MKKILIAEDDQSLLSVLTEKLTSEGFKIAAAQDGDEACAQAFSQHPDLVILDIMMPKLDGKAVLRQIRRDEWGKDVPIILMSNLDYSVHASEVATFKINDYIVKVNTSLEEIVQKIKKVINS